MTRDLGDLARSGQGWARQALIGPRVYFSAAGFTERFRRLRQEEGNVYLVTLEDMYSNLD